MTPPSVAATRRMHRGEVPVQRGLEHARGLEGPLDRVLRLAWSWTVLSCRSRRPYYNYCVWIITNENSTDDCSDGRLEGGDASEYKLKYILSQFCSS
jgi:hypothetical protein